MSELDKQIEKAFEDWNSPKDGIRLGEISVVIVKLMRERHPLVQEIAEAAYTDRKEGYTAGTKQGCLNALRKIRNRASTKKEKELWDNTDLNYLTKYIDSEIEKLRKS